MKIDGLKEIICAALGLAIVVGCMVMVYFIYGEGGNSGDKFVLEAYQRHLQLLNLALAFAGTVVGYYFGRMPAEKATAVAQSQTKDAIEKQERLKSGLRDVKADLNNATPPSGGAPPATVSAVIQKIDALL